MNLTELVFREEFFNHVLSKSIRDPFVQLMSFYLSSDINSGSFFVESLHFTQSAAHYSTDEMGKSHSCPQFSNKVENQTVDRVFVTSVGKCIVFPSEVKNKESNMVEEREET